MRLSLLIMFMGLSLVSCAPATQPANILSCQENSDCLLPMDYAVRSNCPYSTACVNQQCAVICPMWQHAPEYNLNLSYQVACQKDSDCDCQQWDAENKYACQCVQGQCSAIVDWLKK